MREQRVTRNRPWPDQDSSRFARPAALLLVVAFSVASACGDNRPEAARASTASDVAVPTTSTERIAAAASTTEPAAATTTTAADETSGDTSEIPASATPFAVTGRSRSFIGQAPANARTDPLAPADNATLPPFVLDEVRWLVGDCCRVGVVLQDERPLYPDDQLIRQITAGNLTWDIYDIGPNDGTTIAAVTTVGDLSVSVGGQTLFKDRPGVPLTIDVVESLARTITIEEG